jgi:hypothetical protein
MKISINWLLKKYTYKFISEEAIEFLAAISVVDNATSAKTMEDLLFHQLKGDQQKVVMKFYLSKYKFINSFKPFCSVDIKKEC